MGIKAWISKTLGFDGVKSEEVSIYEFMGYAEDVYIRELAFNSCVNIIANAVSKCEFKTYLNGKEEKGAEYYLWNVEPNQNQSSSVFIHKLISKLYRNNEVLIVESNNQLLVADSYNRKPYALYEDVFSQVQVGDFVFNRTFQQSEVLFFKLHEENVRRITSGLFESYGNLITYGMKSYQKSRGNRGVLEISAMAQADNKFQKTFETLMNERFKTFFNSENAVLPLFNGYQYTDIGSKTYSNEGTRDIRAMIDDVSDFTARGFGVPPVLLSGTVQGNSEAVEQLLTFCVDPLVDHLQEEINRKRNGMKAYLSGTKLQIDTKSIKHIDLLSVSSAIDKLIGSGAFCINDIRKVCGENIINEPWAGQHFMTKNYSSVEDLLESLQGGEIKI